MVVTDRVTVAGDDPGMKPFALCCQSVGLLSKTTTNAAPSVTLLVSATVVATVVGLRVVDGLLRRDAGAPQRPVRRDAGRPAVVVIGSPQPGDGESNASGSLSATDVSRAADEILRELAAFGHSAGSAAAMKRCRPRRRHGVDHREAVTVGSFGASSQDDEWNAESATEASKGRVDAGAADGEAPSGETSTVHRAKPQRAVVLRTMASPPRLDGTGPVTRTALSAMFALDAMRSDQMTGSRPAADVADLTGSKSQRTLENAFKRDDPLVIKQDGMLGLRRHVDSDWRRIQAAAGAASAGDRGGWRRLWMELSMVEGRPYGGADASFGWADEHPVTGASPAEHVAEVVTRTLTVLADSWLAEPGGPSANAVIELVTRMLHLVESREPWSACIAAARLARRAEALVSPVSVFARAMYAQGYEPPDELVALLDDKVG